MSVWTHIAGVIRVDTIRGLLPTPDFNKIFIKSLWGDDTISNMPSGSEGSLDYRVIENPNKNSIAAYNVVIFGDLRDVGADDVPDIKEWWEYTLTQFDMVRQAVLQIRPENGDTVILEQKDNE